MFLLVYASDNRIYDLLVVFDSSQRTVPVQQLKGDTIDIVHVKIYKYKKNMCCGFLVMVSLCGINVKK